MHLLAIAVIALVYYMSFQSGYSCYIQGTDSGFCSDKTLDLQYRIANMPYCSKYVKYPACLPMQQSIPPLRSFPEGRWNDHRVDKKDEWVSQTTEAKIFERRRIERNKTLINGGINEYGEEGSVIVRFYKNADCMNAFRAFSCYINFPRCSMKTGETLPTCRSACENFFISCRYKKDLWRCGKSKYFNGYAPESPSGLDKNGTPVYLRDYFPGQPFRANKFDKNEAPVAVCTPSILGAASGPSRGFSFMFLTFIALAIALVFQVIF